MFHLRKSTVFQLLKIVLVFSFLMITPLVSGDDDENTANDASENNGKEKISLPEKVDVNTFETADDGDIAQRLTDIGNATGWFQSLKIDVDEGVVFFDGLADSKEHKTWISELAKRTEDVVAVVNRMTVKERPMWDMGPAWNELNEILKSATSNLPLFVFSLILLIVTIIASKITYQVSKSRLSKRINNRLLYDVASRAIAGIILIIGIYLVLRISGLTRLAATIIGGTGLLGIVFGFAFRDIAENFLASILISVQRPFRIDDLIEVEGITGYVRSVTTRGTVIQTFAGNHVHISNASIYKNQLTNYSSNPSSRDEMELGIGFDAPISKAQSIIIEVLKAHPGILNAPEPQVLVNTLGSATINLKIYAWVNSKEFSIIKVRSSVLRKMVANLTREGISMPDEAREVIFPDGVDVRTHSEDSQNFKESQAEKNTLAIEDDESVEDLSQEKTELDRQHEQADQPEAGESLI